MSERDAADAETDEQADESSEGDAGADPAVDAGADESATEESTAGGTSEDESSGEGAPADASDGDDSSAAESTDEVAATETQTPDERGDLANALEAVIDADADVDDGEFDGEVDESLVDRVAAEDPESVARELAALRVRVDALDGQLRSREVEIEDLESKLKRKQADFQNYKKRMEKRREEEQQRATEDLVERLLDVRDNLVRALEQDDADADAIRNGVESTLTQFDRVLDDENVDVVEPEPGDEVDPHRHEVLMRIESDEPADTVADVHRPGYVMAEKVLRPAQVTVSENGDAADESETE